MTTSLEQSFVSNTHSYLLAGYFATCSRMILPSIGIEEDGRMMRRQYGYLTTGHCVILPNLGARSVNDPLVPLFPTNASSLDRQLSGVS